MQPEAAQIRPRPAILVTNDDGIQSLLLLRLVEACMPWADVCVAAPDRERSWCGKSLTRIGRVSARNQADYPTKAWAVGGTPADCVNIALAHLVDRRPDLVLSGINYGYNVTLPLILSSGTVAGALESLAAGVRALSFSLQVPYEIFDEIKGSPAREQARHPGFDDAVRAAAARCAAMAREELSRPGQPWTFCNINLPYATDAHTAVVDTFADPTPVPPLFVRDDDDFVFHYRSRETPPPAGSDRHAILSGKISRTRLNLGAIS